MPGVPLSPAGEAEAALLAERFAGRPVTVVASSPQDRARATAEPVAAALGVTLVLEPGLDEIDFGAWTGLEFSALEGRADWAAWNRFRSAAAPPGGESMLAVQARALAAARRLAAAVPEAEVVLVSHQDVLLALLAHFLGVPLDLFGRIALDPAHRCVVRLWEADVRVEGVNLPP